MKRLVAPAAVIVVLISATVWYFATQGSGRPLSVVIGSARHVVTLRIDTPRTGDRTVILQIADRSDTAYADPSVPITAVLPTIGYCSPVIPAVSTGDGQFRADGVPLMAPGGWEFHLMLRDDPLVVPVPITS